MTEQEQLPVCALCGEHPQYNGRLVGCSKPTCSVRGALMQPTDWRRLMARPSLAPEHVKDLRRSARYVDDTPYYGVADTIRAALAALGGTEA